MRTILKYLILVVPAFVFGAPNSSEDIRGLALKAPTPFLSPIKHNGLSRIAARDMIPGAAGVIRGLLLSPRILICPTGDGECSNGGCCPLGGDCCNDGTCCDSGKWCYAGGCCLRSQEGCANQFCCDPSDTCCSDGCYDLGAQCCLGGGACAAGTNCVVGGCCPDGEICSGSPDSGGGGKTDKPTTKPPTTGPSKPTATTQQTTTHQTTTPQTTTPHITTPQTTTPQTTTHQTATFRPTANGNNSTPTQTTTGSSPALTSVPTAPGGSQNVVIDVATNVDISWVGQWVTTSSSCSPGKNAKSIGGNEAVGNFTSGSMSYSFSGSSVYVSIASNNAEYSISLDADTIFYSSGEVSSTSDDDDTPAPGNCTYGWNKTSLSGEIHILLITSLGPPFSKSKRDTEAPWSLELQNFVITQPDSEVSGSSSESPSTTPAGGSSIGSGGALPPIRVSWSISLFAIVVGVWFFIVA